MPSLKTIRAGILTALRDLDTPATNIVLGDPGPTRARRLYGHGGRLAARSDLNWLVRQTPAVIVSPLGWNETRWLGNVREHLVMWAMYLCTHTRTAVSPSDPRTRDAEAFDLVVPLDALIVSPGFIAKANNAETHWHNLFAVDNDEEQAIAFNALLWESWLNLDEDPGEPVFNKFRTLYSDIVHGPLLDDDLTDIPNDLP